MAQQDSRKLERSEVPRHLPPVGWLLRRRVPAPGQATQEGVSDVGARPRVRESRRHDKAPESKQTVVSYAATWIDFYRGRTARGLDDETRSCSTAAHWIDHITPREVSRRGEAEGPRSTHIRRFGRWLEKDKVAPATIRKAKRCLSAMLATAAQDGAISRTTRPSACATRPAPAIAEREELAQAERKRRALSADQVLAVIAATPDRWHTFFMLLAETGCRVAELIGLRWENVHLEDDPHIYVCEQWNGNRYKRLKTDASEEPIPLSPPMAQWLGPKIDREDATGPVFPSKTGTPARLLRTSTTGCCCPHVGRQECSSRHDAPSTPSVTPAPR